MVYDPIVGGNAPDPILTNISLSWPNEGMVADALFPVVPVSQQYGQYWVHGRESWMAQDDERAPGTRTLEIPGLQVSREPYFAKEYALQLAIPDEEREIVASPLDSDRDGTELVTSRLMLARELRMFTMATTVANYHTGHSVTLAGTDRWDDYANSTPIADIKAGKRQIHSAIFLEPNVIVIPYEVMSVLEDHPDFIERIKYSERGIITAEIIASVLGFQRVIVPGMGFNTEPNPAQTPTISYLWGDSVVMAWVPPRAGLRIPAFAYEFNWRYPGGQVQIAERWRSNERRSDIIRVSRRYDLRMIAVDSGTDGSIAGYVIKDTLS